MNMNIGTVRVVDEAAVQYVGALVRGYACLRVYPEMQAVKIVHTVTEAFLHGSQEAP